MCLRVLVQAVAEVVVEVVVVVALLPTYHLAGVAEVQAVTAVAVVNPSLSIWRSCLVLLTRSQLAQLALAAQPVLLARQAVVVAQAVQVAVAV